MNERNKNRPGYKETKVGWIPEEWGIEPFSRIFKKTAESVIPKTNEYYQEIGVRSHGKGIFHKLPVTGSTLGEKRVFKCHPGTLVFNIVFAWEQAVAVVSENEKGMIASHRFPMYQGKKGKAFEPFFMWHFKTPRGKYDLNLASPGGAGRNKTLGQQDLNYLFIPLPPLPEQEKIAEILGCWDEGLESLEKLIEAKKLRKKGLMQQLLTGIRRLPEFQRSEWKEVTLGSICTVIRKAVGTKKIIPMSLSAGKGFVSQAEKFGRDISGNQYSKYTHLKKGCFTYNKGNSIRYPQGCAYLLEDYDEVAVPNVFISFKLDDTKADNRFFQQAFAANMHGHDLMKFINSGVRNDGLLNLNTEWFLRITFNLPSTAEQRAIAEVLETADEEIRLLEAERDALSEQKKGLMQKLLTGEVRCPEFRERR
jgi:type I restriction enzyme S subunit